MKECLNVAFNPPIEVHAMLAEQRRTLSDLLDYARKAMNMLVPSSLEEQDQEMKWVYDEDLGRQVWVAHDFDKAFAERKLSKVI